ncbi:MAG: glycosyltransferase family 39 protein [Isosphaeraceae bacterium]
MNLPESRPRDGGLSWRNILILAVFGSTLMTVGFGKSWVLTYHEVFFSQPSREFLESGDWLSPRLLGETNYQKPPLNSWLIAGSMALFRSDAEWVVRLPSLLAGLISALGIAGIAARAYGNRIGLLTGLVNLTTYYAILQTRLAEADMPLCAAVVGGMYCFARGVVLRREGPAWPWSLGYFACAVLAFLFKGPIGPAFVGLPCGFYAIVTRRWAPWKFLLNPVGWAILLVGCLGYPLVAYLKDPSVLDDFRVHNLDRFTGAMPSDAQGPLYYLYMAPLIFLPWTPLALRGLWLVKQDGDRPRDLWRFLACWVGVCIGLITLSAWKHKHYAIPAMPPLSILAALAVARMTDVPMPAQTRRIRWGSVAGVVGAIGLFAWGYYGPNGLILSVAPALAAASIAGLVVAYLRDRDQRPRAVAAAFAGIWVVVVLVQSLVLPRYDRYREQAELAQSVRPRMPADAVIDMVSLVDPQAVWYLQGPKRFTREVDDFRRKVATDDSASARIVVIPAGLLAPLKDLGTVESLVDPVPPHGLTAVRLIPDPERMALVADEVVRRR